MIHSPRKLLPLLSIGVLISSCAPAPNFYKAQNLSAKPFNQLDLACNACGPAALLNSYRFGNQKWRVLSEKPPGLTDRERIRSIARGPAMRESSSLPGRARWTRNGINLTDLKDVANELAYTGQLPRISEQMLFLKPNETQQGHLRRVHSLLTRSLSEGFPPIITIRRFVERDGAWRAVQGHFVTITSVPGKLPNGADEFTISYIDPWGGKFHDGKIAIHQSTFLGTDPAKNPNLEAIFPSAVVGKRLVRPGETTLLAVSAFLGRP